MHAGGIFTTPQSLKEETYQRLKNELKENMQGLVRHMGVMLLEQDLKFNQISINPDDAQLLESKNFRLKRLHVFLECHFIYYRV
jgi:Phage-related protein